MELPRVRFSASGAFHPELKRRVAAYFVDRDTASRDSIGMYVKTAFILSWTVVSYLLLMFVAVTWWQCLLLGSCMAMGLAGIGFSIQHDANHGGYSTHRWLNRILGCSLDMMGASSYVWYWRHNIIHHTFTNVSGIDVDAEMAPFLRLAPDQPLHCFHRYQHFYIWFLYAFMMLDWHFWADYRDLFNGRVGRRDIPSPSPSEWLGIVLGKTFFYGWSTVLPLTIHSTWSVVGVFLFVSFLMGVLMATTFQLAHCIVEADVVAIDPTRSEPLAGWAEHQVRTTANFAPGNRFLTWYLGGLNYQIEHHLFPKICHVHYPALSRIVSSTCRDFGIPYQSHTTLPGALSSHVRWLRGMGRSLAAV